MRRKVLPIPTDPSSPTGGIAGLRLEDGHELTPDEAWAMSKYHHAEFVVERDGHTWPITFDAINVTVVRMACHGLPA